jgi:hypothetical protein
MQPQPSRRLVVVASLIAFVLVGIIALKYYDSLHGTLQMDFQVPDTSSLSLSINSKNYQPVSLADNYTLHRGTYTVRVTKTGYQPFSAGFSIKTGQTVIVNADLVAEVTPPALSLSTTYTSGSVGPGAPTLASTLPSTTTIDALAYFYGQTWAVLTLDQHTGIGIIVCVAQYQTASHAWVVAVQPDDDFSSNSVASLPPLVSTYVHNNFTVNPGDQEDDD